MKRLVPVLLIIIFAIILSVGVSFINRNTNEIETSQMEIVNKIVLTYSYYSPTILENGTKLTIEIINPEDVKSLTKSFENLDTTNYSDKIGLIISGIYQADFENGSRILFDSNTDEYASFIKNEKRSLIKVPKEFKDKIVEEVDKKLTEKAKQYETEKVTLSQEGIEAIEIEESFVVATILENTKNIAIDKNIDMRNFNKSYEINFNNGIRIEVCSKEYIGKLYQDQEPEKQVRLPVELVDLLENRINNEKNGKTALFQTDVVTLEHAGTAKDIIAQDKIEAIAKRLAYSKISHLNYLDGETFEIKTTADDYILNINGNRLIIYNNTTYASRQIIYQDGTYDDITFAMGVEELIKNLAN